MSQHKIYRVKKGRQVIMEAKFNEIYDFLKPKNKYSIYNAIYTGQPLYGFVIETTEQRTEKVKFQEEWDSTCKKLRKHKNKIKKIKIVQERCI